MSDSSQQQPPPEVAFMLRCTRCKRHKPATRKYFVQDRVRVRAIDGRPVLKQPCRSCASLSRAGGKRHEHESDMAGRIRKDRAKARQQALVRLKDENIKRFDALYLEEMSKLGWDGDEDLRSGANRKRGERKWRKVYCRARASCGWSSSRKNDNDPTRLPCPWCGGKVAMNR